MSHPIRKPFFFIGVVLWLTVFSALAVVVFTRTASKRGDDSTDISMNGGRVSVVNDGTGLPYLFDLPPFEMVNQSNATVTDQKLRGGPVVLCFIFTNCAGPCPIMTAKMAKLHKEVTDPKVKFLSVSVDPDRDTAEVLTEYGKQFEADFTRWWFLTTPDVRRVYQLSAGLRLAAMPADGETPIIHSEKLVLVDSNGRVRGMYSSNMEDEVKQLVADVRALAEVAK